MMRKLIITTLFVLPALPALPWGFFGHKMINRHAIFLLPPEMMILYKPHLDFIEEHAVDPDKRRYAVKQEAPRHYIDMDRFHPWDSIPSYYNKAVEKYGEDSLARHGIVPWWIQTMTSRLTKAFELKDKFAIIKLSAELGHYISDAHVPLHTSSNHNGQLTNQVGIHGFWESRVPELFAEQEFDLIVGKARYIKSVSALAWKVVKQSAAASDSVLRFEMLLNNSFRTDAKFSYENRNGVVVRQYSTAYSKAYHDMLNGMVERRMRESILATASLWYTAWVNVGQPDLREIAGKTFTDQELEEWEQLNREWKELGMAGSSCAN
ncbi:MAG TPA: zinc dependent phospholipase C family protein [Chitinophagaceae bacterium]|nr:zinc dependent phospholipase C family protein [Chitinophagaceae bacterium]